MSEIRNRMLDRIRRHFPFGIDQSVDMNEDSLLSDLGVTSIHLLTLVTSLEREYDFDLDQLADMGMPTTIGDLVTMMAASCLNRVDDHSETRD